MVSNQDTILISSTVDSPIPQKALSFKIDPQQFRALLDSSSPANKARLLSVSAPHASSWLSVVPSVELGLHLDPHEFCVGIRWWLGVDISRGLPCPLCPITALDPLDHHGITCKKGGDVVTRHNRLRDVFVDVMRPERDTGSARLDWLTYIKRKYIYMSIMLRNACSAHARITPLPLFFLVVYICSVAIRSFSCSGWISVWSLFYTVWNWFRLVFYCR